ncbi:MAG TPA: hypothetical protein ENN29_09045 [Candidatus Hydrogenedentes bacterium]|nr:hypothetical protein [Candidatus Hydrogenedentota bacterium]
MNIQFTLSPEERNLILQRVDGLGEETRTYLRLGVVGRDGLLFEMPKYEFVYFLDSLEYAATNTDDRELMNIFTQLYALVEEEGIDNLEFLDDEDFLDDEENVLDPKIEEEFIRLLQERRPETFEEAFSILKEFVAERALLPKRDFDGLSLEQLYRMLNTPWDDPDSAIMLREDVSSELLSNNTMLHNARLLLNKIQETGHDKATAKGNLNQKLVKALRPHLKGTYLAQSRYDDYKKVWREGDLRPLIILRALLLEGRYLRKAKGFFKVTQKGKRLLAPEKDGALLADLFHTYFRKYNIAYADRLPPCETIQYSIPYSLLMIKRYATEWIALEDLSELIFPPFVEEQIRMENSEFYFTFLARIRVLEPLREFGLLESNEDEEDDETFGFLSDRSRLRITPLFDALIEFRL